MRISDWSSDVCSSDLLSFQAYWALFMAALLAVAAALWVRGTETGWRERVHSMRARLLGPAGAVLAVSLAGFVATGAWLFWNTNMRNEYVPPDVQRDLMARYEREYKRYERSEEHTSELQSLMRISYADFCL